MRRVEIVHCDCGCNAWGVRRDGDLVAYNLDMHEARCVAALLAQMEQIRHLANAPTHPSVN